MDAFDEMRNMNIVASNMDPDDMDTNQQQQQQQQILHHTTTHHYQDNTYGIQHHDQHQIHHNLHSGNVVVVDNDHLQSNNHNLVDDNSHINEISSHINSSNIHLHINDNISVAGAGDNNENIGDGSNISDHLPVDTVKINNYETSSSMETSDVNTEKTNDTTDEKVLFEVIASFDESNKVQSNLEENNENNIENFENTGSGGETIITNNDIKNIEIHNENVDKDIDDDDDDDDNNVEKDVDDENIVEKDVDDENNVDDDAMESTAIEGDNELAEQPKPNGVTEVILMDEPVVDTEGEEEGVEEDSQEDVLAGELADSEVAKTIDVKPISNFVIKVKDIMKDDKPHINRRKITNNKSESPIDKQQRLLGPKSRARSNTPIDKNSNDIINNKNGNTSTSPTLQILPKKGEDIDENQCRICLSKDDLVSIFKSENRQTIADKIITICTGVRIQRKDFLPQFICNTCMQSVQVAYNLKRLCEATDKDLRSKLSRSKKNMRRPTEYVLLDATKFGESDESVDDEPSDDDEFKISNEEELKTSEQDSEVDSDYGSGKRRSRRVRSKKPQPRRRTSKPKPQQSRNQTTVGTFRQVNIKSPITTSIGGGSSASSRPAPASVKRSRRSDSSYEHNQSYNQDFSSGSDDDFSPPKKRSSRSSNNNNNNMNSTKSNASKEGHCIYCNEIFPSQNALQKHKKIHAGEKPLICELCGKNFKMAPSYQAHLAKHKEDGDTLTCTKCDKTFQKLSDRRKHMIEEHNEKPETFPCEKCKRVFSIKKSLEKHIDDGKCPGPRKQIQTQPPRRVKSEMENLTLGRDLFKCVAPVTTTYWSDSFSD